MGRTNQMFQRAGRPAAIGLAYFAAATAAVTLTRFEGGVAFIWMANAFLLAQLSLLSYERWSSYLFACAVACFLVTSVFGLGPAAAPFLIVINLAEAVIGAALLRRWLGGSAYFESMGALAAFVVVAGIVAPGVTAFAAAAVASHFGSAGYGSNWLHWYVGHGLGAITFTPIALLVLSGEVGGWAASMAGKRKLEAALLLAAVVAASMLVFAQAALPLLFLPILPMVIATFRLGRFGAAASAVILAIVGGVLTVRGYGPVSLIDASDGERAQFFQFYLAICVAIALPIAVELRQRHGLFLSLHESEARYRLLADNSSDVILKLSVDGEILYASPSVRQLAGYAPEALVGGKVHGLIYDEDIGRVVAAHADALADPNSTFIVEYRCKIPAGGLIWLETHTRSVVDDGGRVASVISSIRDISNRKALELRLQHSANTDPLTGIANRRAFNVALDGRIAEASRDHARGCLATFDLDHFKTINDRHGHETGDDVLKSFAATVKAVLRDTDVVARLGGEEFGLILWGAGLDQAEAICERIREKTATRLVSASRASVTVSAGIAVIDGTRSRTAVLRAADEALYRAKAAGRNCLKRAA